MFAYTFYVHCKIDIVMYSNENNGWRRLDLNVNSYDWFNEMKGEFLPDSA